VRAAWRSAVLIGLWAAWWPTFGSEPRTVGPASGRDDYRAADARREADYQRRVQAFSADDRRLLSETERRAVQACQLESQGKPRDALPLAEQALANYRRLLGENDARTALALSLVGQLQQELGNLNQAEARFLEAQKVNRQVLGENHPELARGLNDLGSLALARADYRQAQTLFRQSLDIVRRTLGEDHPGYAATLNNLALATKSLGEYSQAETLYRQVLEAYRRAGQENTRQGAAILSNLGNLALAREDYRQAETLLQQAFALRQKTLGDDHPELAISLNDLGALYRDQADYARAESLYRRAMAIRKQQLGDKHPDYLSTVNNLAGVYLAQGQPARALPLLLEAQEGCRQAFGERHPRYAGSLNNSAVAYRAQGDYTRAEALLRRALAIVRKTPGENSPDFAAALNNLADLQQSQGAFASAEPLLHQALDIKRRLLGIEHPGYALSLNNLAALNYHAGNYAQAEPLYRQALDIDRRAFGEGHPAYAQTLNNLAALYAARGDYAQAETLCQQAVALRRRILGTSHPGYAASLNNLGAVRLLRGNPSGAEPLLREALTIVRAQLESAAVGQSDRQQLTMLHDVRFYLDSYLSLAADDPRFTDEAYRNVLAWKGAVLRRQRLARAAREDAGLREAFGRLQVVARRLTSQAWTTPTAAQQSAWLAAIADLSASKERLEAELATRCARFAAALRPVSPEDILAALPTDAALVDFLEYDHSLSGGAESAGKLAWQRRLLAFVSVPGHKVALIRLGDVQPVREAVDAWRRTLGTSPVAAEAGRRLRRLVWEPLQDHLARAKVLLESPDGPLCRFPLAALPGAKDGSYLLEELPVATVPMPQMIPEIIHRSSNKPAARNLLLLGNVDYDLRSDSHQPQARPALAQAGRSLAQDLGSFEPLAGTNAEITGIGQVYQRQFGRNGVTVLEHGKASKRELLADAAHHRYLHLATHGFFLEDPLPTASGAGRQPSGQFGEMVLRPESGGLYPGLLAGLALAGANRIESPGTVSDADGILTAEEIAAQDLDGVRLAVLSACETGLGKATRGEGLIGLQRAFEAAGVSSVVASLWSVPDEETRWLMETFYEKHWHEGLGLLPALRAAQLAILRGEARRSAGGKSLALHPNRRPPFYWAAFVLAGDWR
jgi:CHAT domain-containing protein/Flp pilus assembly protein TadD